MVLQKPVGTTRLENAEIFRKVRKTTFSRSPPGQSLCQWRQKGVSRPNSGGVAADFHDAQLENQTSDRLRIGGNLLVTNSSIDCESFISGLSSPLIPLLPWVKVYRKEPSAFIYDEHSRECTMFHFGIYSHFSIVRTLNSTLGICTHTYTVTRASVTLPRTHDPMLLSSQVFVPPFPWLNFPFPCFLYRLSIYRLCFALLSSPLKKKKMLNNST